MENYRTLLTMWISAYKLLVAFSTASVAYAYYFRCRSKQSIKTDRESAKINRTAEDSTPASSSAVGNAAFDATANAPADEAANSPADAPADATANEPTTVIVPPRHLDGPLLNAFKNNDIVAPVASSSAGFGLVASRAISAGETVLRLRPDVSAPSWPCDASQLSPLESAVCRSDVGTGASFVENLSERTAEAAWAAGEVQALWLLAIRCALLGRSKPALLAAMLQLESHCSVRPPHAQAVIVAAASRLTLALSDAADLVIPQDVAVRLMGVLLTKCVCARELGTQRSISERSEGMRDLLAVRMHALRIDRSSLAHWQLFWHPRL